MTCPCLIDNDEGFKNLVADFQAVMDAWVEARDVCPFAQLAVLQAMMSVQDRSDQAEAAEFIQAFRRRHPAQFPPEDSLHA